ncbi:MAG: hypothetical protein SNJ85_10530 [Cyanobacteriota bacterium]
MQTVTIARAASGGQWWAGDAAVGITEEPVGIPSRLREPTQ